MKIDASNVRKFVDYDSTTGFFVWRRRDIRPGMKLTDEGWNTRFAGKPVADRYQRNGHLQIQLFCRNYMAHRIAWMHWYGADPEMDIDHINGKPADNRISNLRLATDSENLMNAKRRVDNTSGVKGVSWSKKHSKWYAYITKDGHTRSLGCHPSFDGAVLARKKAEAVLHGRFARAA